MPGDERSNSDPDAFVERNMIIQLFDVDEVILKFCDGFLAFINSRLGTNHKSDSFDDYDLKTSLNIPEFDDLFKEFISSKRIGELEFYDDAVEYFEKTPDVTKILLTALPDTDVTRMERRRNLERLKYGDLIFDSDKAEYVSIFRPKLIFEDKPANVLDYLAKRKYFGKICVPRRRYTMGLERELNDDPQVVFYDAMTELL